MTNSEWQRKIRQCIGAMRKYHKLLAEVEDEFERRYGDYPSDFDLAYWIDPMHVNGLDTPSVSGTSQRMSKLGHERIDLPE